MKKKDYFKFLLRKNELALYTPLHIIAHCLPLIGCKTVEKYMPFDLTQGSHF